jgi:hypothetical protein
MEWLKTLLYGKKLTHNRVFYMSKAPNPKKGWLKKSALMVGDLWFDTSHTPHVWADGRWKKLGTD